jgi:hypothetical protein
MKIRSVIAPLALSCVLGAAAVIFSCNGSSGAGLSASCSINTDCNSPLVCAFARCHAQCVESRDCTTPGERCVSSGTGPRVCQLPPETACATGTSCSGTQVCSPTDQQCRQPCQTNADCAGGQFCIMSGAALVCLQVSTPADEPALMSAGILSADGAVLVEGGGGGLQPDGGGMGSGGDATVGGGDSGSVFNPCPSAQTSFGSTAQGDSNPNFTSGVGVRTKTQLLIFSGFAGGGDAGDAGTDNLVYVEAFDPTTANSLGPAQPLFAAPDGSGFVLDSASIAPTGEIALAFSYGGPYSYINGSQYTQTSLYAAFLGASAEAGPAGLALQSTKELQTGGGPLGSAHFGIYGQPHVIWSVAAGAFVFSWEYFNAGNAFVGTAKFRPNGQAAGGTNPVPTDDLATATVFFPNAYGLNQAEQGSFAAGPNFSGVAFQSFWNGVGLQYLTILDQSGNQVGSSVPIYSNASQVGYLWVTVAATAEGFVYIYDVPSNSNPANSTPNSVLEVFVPTSGDAGVVLPDAGDAGVQTGVNPPTMGYDFTGFKFTGVTANNGHAISDDTGGAGGVGVALLYSTGLSFAYVNANGTTHVGPTSVIPHTYAADDLINITNFGGSFGLSLYSAASQSTQMAGSGCQ